MALDIIEDIVALAMFIFICGLLYYVFTHMNYKDHYINNYDFKNHML